VGPIAMIIDLWLIDRKKKQLAKPGTGATLQTVS